VIGLWVLALIPLLTFLGTPPAQRTQEARVLEVAREMLDANWRGWVVPHLNGAVRFEKPPLAYWVSAGAYKLLGVNEFSGRLPMALAAWGTLGVTYACGAWLFGRAAGLLSAGVLLTSYLFFRHGRLAETDILVTFFATFTGYALWRGWAADVARPRREGSWPSEGSFAWFQVSGAALGLAVLAKGPPAATALLFFVGLVAMTRRWGTLLRWLTSGAPITTLLVAVPWFAYVAPMPEFKTAMANERAALAGQDHGAWFYVYFPMLLKAAAPWSGMVIVALVAAARVARRDAGARGLLLWAATIFVPLCFVPNKQEHYLLVLIPVLAMLVGWAIDTAAHGRGEAALPGRAPRDARAVMWITAGATLVAASGIPAAAHFIRGRLDVADLAIALLAATLIVLAGHTFRRRGAWAGGIAFAAACAIVFPAIFGGWLPSLEPVNARSVAATIRRDAGEGPYRFYGQRDSITLVFALRQVIPIRRTAEELLADARANPSLVVITQEGKRDNVPPPMPAGFVEVAKAALDEHTVRVWRWR